ncbi:conserved hypothetical protein [Microsporum canis CBS 113480]|uniref:Uncharacterized protein n=1 Tax=Arthroderma otae (strain ATCC MYA-4605 / CBS 113480) TaxID=554155 RepID=C5FQR5_ARTOC|nr:conserved hypothetical protein [Microsporum canis CBS 113480]EEQ32218.1 conserved hypothetical protein [Microsporum canis CBS 113480]
MGTRGLWNLHFAGKWYRFHDRKSRICSPHEPGIVRRIQSIVASLDDLKGWEPVPFPSPLPSNLDYVYTIDVDAGTLTITRWESVDAVLQPFPRQIKLSCLDESHGLTLDSLERAPSEVSALTDSEAVSIPGVKVELQGLDIRPGPPTPLNELQFRVSLDFCFVWRAFIDDPTSWRYPSMGFNTLAIGLLRIAAWDLEVSSDTEIDYPVNGVTFPRWEAPQADVFWFHGYLVVLHATINTDVSLLAAISKAQSFLRLSHKDTAHLIILSLRHVAFVEISSRLSFAEPCSIFVLLEGILGPEGAARVWSANGNPGSRSWILHPQGRTDTVTSFLYFPRTVLLNDSAASGSITANF